MLTWRLRPNNPNSSRLHEASRLLKDLKMKQTVEAFLRSPYMRAKASLDIDVAADKENRDRWKKQTEFEGDSYAAARLRKVKSTCHGAGACSTGNGCEESFLIPESKA